MSIGESSTPTVTYRDLSWAPAYRCGDDGSIWSRYARGGTSNLSNKWRRLCPTPNRTDGRLSVRLAANGKKSLYYVHRLVLEAFIGPCPPGMEACHFPDRDPANNRLANLRWDTSKGNKEDELMHGTQAIGSKSGRAKLTEANIPIIRTLWARGHGAAVIARRYGVDRKTIVYVIEGRTWRHVAV